MLTQSRLRELLRYDPETGVFTWKVRTAKRVKVGDVAGNLRPTGYRYIKTDGKPYPAHRLAWLYMTGSCPANQLDHINGIRDDNRIANLREATNAENGQNRKLSNTSTSGLMGVCWHKRDQRWAAQIRIAGRKKNLGHFDTPEAAHAAYLAAKAKYHPFQPTVRQAAQ